MVNQTGRSKSAGILAFRDTVRELCASVAPGQVRGFSLLVPLTGELRALLERRRTLRRLDCPLVFHRGAGEPLGDFRKVWVTSCTTAKLPGLLFHDLRRSARNMVRAGVPERVAMTLSGHRTRAVFDRYDIVSEDDLAAATARTADYVAAQEAVSSSVVDLAAERATREPGGMTGSCGSWSP